MNKSEPTKFDKLLKRIKNNKVLSIVLVLGVFIITIGTFTDALTKIITFISTEPTRLEVTDILVQPDKEGTKILDIRIVNNSKKTITASRLRLKVLSFEDKMAGRPRPKSNTKISAKYNVNLGELRRTGQNTEIPIAHDLQPGTADRFSVVVGMENLRHWDHYAWELDTELVTNVGIASGPEVSIDLP